MKKGVDWFIEKGILFRSAYISRLTERFLDKARNNLVTMSILSEIQDNEAVRDILHVPEDYDPNEWVVVCGYYAMYMAAYATLAKTGYKSKNHTATIVALYEFFVKRQTLEPKYLASLKKAKLEKEHIEQLKIARDRREIAQYSVTKQTTKTLAEKIKKDAYAFVRRIEKLMAKLSEPEISQETKEQIEEARARMKKGEFHTEKEAKKTLGI